MEAAKITTETQNKSENARCSAAKMQQNQALEGATPAMRQFFLIKANYDDCLLFYRMGDFYELFFQDAIDAAAILDIALTKRGKHAGEEIPMCGVPVHSHEMYLEKLIASGRKVAICEQLETPEEAKKRGGHKAVVNRDVVRVVTPGTITEESLLAPNQSHYLAALAFADAHYSLAWVDISTGEFCVAQLEESSLAAELSRIAPKELLVSDALNEKLNLVDWQDRISLQPASQFDLKKTERSLLSHYAVQSLDAFGELQRSDIAAAGALLEYIQLTQMEQLPRLDPPSKQQNNAAMLIDAATRRNLELVGTLSGSRKGSLLSIIDRTVTGAGGRLLSNWLTAPLTNVQQIEIRQRLVGWALGQESLSDYIRVTLGQTPDMERAISRLCMHRGGPRDMMAVRKGLEAAQAIKEQIQLKQQQPEFAEAMPQGLIALIDQLGDQSELVDLLTRALQDELPLLARDGNFIAGGYSADLDHFRSLRDDSKRIIAAMQKELSEQTGISTLKIKFNNVLGYFIEITAAHERKVPEQFIHRQTLANNLRYTTTELADTARSIAEASERALQIELGCFEDLLNRLTDQADVIIHTARALAQFDVFTALAELAREEQYVCPTIDDSTAFDIKEGRHPVVEASLKRSGERFMANDCDLSDAQRLWLLTGPNMAGKSTFLRQNALIAILAQMGSYVPASSAHIGVVDRLFSRVGAADDLARGQSTFMVEMVETATILHQATPHSLVILDEIGRGTATYDGLSIAWAVVEQLHERTQCRALFATHYHELTQLSTSLPKLACHTMRVKEWQDKVIFLHQVKPGTADRSYGIHVAQLAGLPQPVINRAKQVLADLERRGQGALSVDLPLFSQPLEEAAPANNALQDKLGAINPDELSPKEALEMLYKLKQT